MANRLYNKQVTPKGYQDGGKVKEEPMRDRKKQPLKRKAGPMSGKMGKKKFKFKLSEAGKRRVKSRMTGGDSIGILFPDVYKVKKMGGGMIKRPMYKDGSLKAVPAGNKGLKKLPTKVRNKMGFMQSGGVAKSARHPHSKLKTQKELKKITDSAAYKKADYAGKTKMLGGKVLN